MSNERHAEQPAERPEPHPSEITELGGPDGVERLVRSLAGIMRDGDLNQVDLKVGRLSIRLRGSAKGSANGADPARATTISEPELAAPVAEHIVSAPMIGTYYASPSPGAAPYVEVGDHIAAGQVVGIIEAMKIMNEIVADHAGVVAAILATNGQPVEYGSPLILLNPTGTTS